MMEIDYALMTLWVRWAAIVIAFTYVITQSTIFMPLRVWITKGTRWRRTLFYCPACMGFWVGLLAGVALYWPFDYGLDAYGIARECFESACASMVLGAIWGHWHQSIAFESEAELRGEDPNTFMPLTAADDTDDDEAEDDSA